MAQATTTFDRDPFRGYRHLDEYVERVQRHLMDKHEFAAEYVPMGGTTHSGTRTSWAVLADMITIHDDLHNRTVHYREVDLGTSVPKTE